MSVGGGKNKSSGSNSQKMQSFISPDQLPFLKNLWSGASSAIGGGVGAADTASGQGFLNTMQENPFSTSLQQFAQPNNAMAQQQISLLGNNLTRNLQENLLPSIADQSIQGGGLGGGRQGIAQGIAMRGTQDALASGAQGILSNVYNQAQQASQFGADWATRNAMGGADMLGSLQQQQFAPWMALAQILGNPTVLQSSKGKGGQSASGFNFNMGFLS